MRNATVTFSRRIDRVQPSLTLKITALAAAMKQEGIDVIGFGAGEPDFDTPEAIKEAGIQAIRTGKNKYTAESGISELKQAICQKLKKDQHLDYTNENILVSCGAKHSLFNCVLALVDSGDEVIIPGPYWVSYPEQVNLADGTPVFISTDESTNFKITPSQLRAAITPKTKMIILASPSNPTGMIYSQEEMSALGEIILENNLWVISDEIYEKLIYRGSHTSIASISPALKAQTVLVNGVSKAYAMTGWRIGYCAADSVIIKAMTKIQSHATSNPTTNSQWAALEALKGHDEEIMTMCAEFKKRRRVMVDTLNKIPGISCIDPDGAFYAFPNISQWFGKTSNKGILIQNSMDFCNALLQEENVACVPGSGFGADNYMRLSYATSMDAIKKGLDRISDFVKRLK